MYTLASDALTVTVDAKGAELKSFRNKQTGLQYLWSGDPAFWAKTSPVLFPVVGALKANAYFYRGKTYGLPRHGFARDKEFAVAEQTENSIRFTLTSDAATLDVFPFQFVFAIVYAVQGATLSVRYVVENKGDEPMAFSVGGHPAFALPLAEGTAYNDYALRFEKEETAGRWPITKDGLIDSAPQPLLQATRELLLTKELFQKDAIVLKGLQSKQVELVSDKTPHGLRFSFDGFPYLGLWAAPGADFLCIEPWCGIADSVDASGELLEKEGIEKLEVGGVFQREWSVNVF